MVSAEEAAAEAVEAGVHQASTPKDSDPVQWPKWRDMCESMKTKRCFDRSLGRQLGILSEILPGRRDGCCSHSQKFTVFDLVFEENRDDGGGLFTVRCGCELCLAL